MLFITQYLNSQQSIYMGMIIITVTMHYVLFLQLNFSKLAPIFLEYRFLAVNLTSDAQFMLSFGMLAILHYPDINIIYNTNNFPLISTSCSI